MKGELLGQMSERLVPQHHGQESQANKAEWAVGEELQRRWTESTLGKRGGGDLEKVKMADGQRGQCEHSALSVAAAQTEAIAVYKN